MYEKGIEKLHISMQGINLQYLRAKSFTVSSIFRSSVKHRFYTNGKCSNTFSFSALKEHLQTDQKWSSDFTLRGAQPADPTRSSPHIQHFQTMPWMLALVWSSCRRKGTHQQKVSKALGVWNSWGTWRGWRSWVCTGWQREGSGHPTGVVNYLRQPGFIEQAQPGSEGCNKREQSPSANKILIRWNGKIPHHKNDQAPEQKPRDAWNLHPWKHSKFS